MCCTGLVGHLQWLGAGALPGGGLRWQGQNRVVGRDLAGMLEVQWTGLGRSWLFPLAAVTDSAKESLHF